MGARSNQGWAKRVSKVSKMELSHYQNEPKGDHTSNNKSMSKKTLKHVATSEEQVRPRSCFWDPLILQIHKHCIRLIIQQTIVNNIEYRYNKGPNMESESMRNNTQIISEQEHEHRHKSYFSDVRKHATSL